MKSKLKKSTSKGYTVNDDSQALTVALENAYAKLGKLIMIAQIKQKEFTHLANGIKELQANISAVEQKLRNKAQCKGTNGSPKGLEE